MDILSGLWIAIDSFWYNILLAVAGLHWGVMRGFVMMGYTVELINNWLAENAFAPLIALTSGSLSIAFSITFVIALLVLGITYLLASIIRLDVVSPRSALLWYMAGLFFFGAGPSLYQGMNDFRTGIGSAFYGSALVGLQGTDTGTFSGLNQVTSADLGMGTLCDHLGPYLPGAAFTSNPKIDGLDVALAYLRADGPDVMGYPQPFYSLGCTYHAVHPFTAAYVANVPMEWFADGSYFDADTSPYSFDVMTNEERAASISLASAAHGRLLTAWPLVLFGVVEQIVYLLITVAQGITFVSFAIAILFAFFKRTEAIAHSVINQWIELIVQTVVIALVQSLVVALFLAGTASNSGMVVLGIGLICLVFMLITLWSGVKAVWNSFNRLFGAFGQATGGAIISPTRAALAGLGAGAAAAGVTASVGSSALAGMLAPSSGATMAQTAGVMLGGFSSLSGAARTLAHLPGVRSTPLGEAAEQFVEGAVTRQVARDLPVVGRVTGPLVGTALLTDRDPDQDSILSRPMLVPAVGDALGSWTTPRGKSKRRATDDSTDWTEDADGEMIPLFTPLNPQRVGQFTPDVQARSEYAAAMQGEEMEQHISEQLDANAPSGDLTLLAKVAAQLAASADALTMAARLQMQGTLRVNGAADVASVLGDVIRLTRATGDDRPDHVALSNRIAQVMGVSPSDNRLPVQENLTRIGLFVDQALQLGLSGAQSESIVREIKESPSRNLSEGTRDALVTQLVQEQRLPQEDARQQVIRLEQYARGLPDGIAAFGSVSVPEVNVTPQIDVTVNLPDDATTDQKSSDSLSGRESVL
jgi:hypothetical protein